MTSICCDGPTLNIFWRLLFASSPTFQKYLVVRVDRAGGKLAIVGIRDGKGRIAAPPAVDMAGYWLLTQHGKKPIEALRLDDLELEQPEWLGAKEWQ